MAGGGWTDDENDALVADYFAMLADDAEGRPFNKAEHNRALQLRIGRPRGSIEYIGRATAATTSNTPC